MLLKEGWPYSIDKPHRQNPEPTCYKGKKARAIETAIAQCAIGFLNE